MSSISVLLVDDQTIIRDGLRALLTAAGGITVAGEAANGRLACEAVEKLKPQVVLMDIRMPEMDGVEATRLIKRDHPGTVVIVLTTFDDDEYIIKAMSCGAAGYLLKDISSERLIQAIHDSLDGNIILPGRIAAKITSHLRRDEHTEQQPVAPVDFTEREIEIIRLMVQGLSNRDIAEKLFLSNGTVKNYISQIYLKIDVSDRARAVLHFKALGF